MDWVDGESEGTDLIPIHVRRFLDEDNILYFSVLLVSRAVLMRRYQFLRTVIEVSNVVERDVSKYGL